MHFMEYCMTQLSSIWLIHFTTVHSRTDTRIRVKEVATLAKFWPGRVALFVQDGKDDEDADGFLIHDTGTPFEGRLWRMTFGAFRMYRAVRKAQPLVAHFHDPELLPWGLLLRLSGIRVIYDVHEDVPRQLQHKPWASAYGKRIVGLIAIFAYLVFEKLALKLLDGIIIVVPSMWSRLNSNNVFLVSNFPKLEEFSFVQRKPKSSVEDYFIYAGGLTCARGVQEMVSAIGLVGDESVRLKLLGSFSERSFEQRIRQESSWKRVDFLGWADRATLTESLSEAIAGLVLLHPTPQYRVAYPVKLFEYMAAGLPVIASDFPIWRQIIAEVGCGLLVDPMDPQAIAGAMQWMLDNRHEAAEMGQRGRLAVECNYNWEAESVVLVELYCKLLASKQESRPA